MGRLEALEARRLLAIATSVWTVTGTAAANVITIDFDPANATRLRAIIDGKVASTRDLDGLTLISLLGGDGNDRITIDLPRVIPGLTVWASGQSGKDKIIGGAEPDILLGSSNRDTLIGGAGNDTLRGGTGNDDLIGDDGDDYVQGNAGYDTCAGGWGADLVTGGTGRDQLRGGDDSDDLYGGQDEDTVKGGMGDDLLSGGADPDLVLSQTDETVLDTVGDSLGSDDVQSPLERLQSEAALRDWLIDQAVAQWNWAFGQPVGGFAWGYDYGTVIFDESASVVNAKLAAPVSAAGDFSTTNTQVQGVDEADIVETDGNYLYMARGDNLVIASAIPAYAMKVAVKKQVTGQISGLYLSGSRIAVISQVFSYRPIDLWRGAPVTIAEDSAFVPAYSKPEFHVTVFDVSDPTAPTKVQETKFDGSLLDSRAIDGRLYLVVQNYLAAPDPKQVKNAEGKDVYETEDAYRARLEAGEWKKMLPSYTATDAAGASKSGSFIAAPNVYVRDENQLDVTSVALIDMNASTAGPSASASIVGWGGEVYASADNLYLSRGTAIGATEIVKFSLGVDQVTLQATGEAEGSVLNSFSMDELGRYFRVATTHGWGTGSASEVSILDQVGDELNVVGSLDGLGVSERIYGARFIANRVYLTTFRQTDPLYALDLTDPTKPKILGELKMPGYSEYIHPIDATHLIGLGRNADETGRVGNVQLSLFDVTDPAKPVRTGTYEFGNDESYTSSVAEWDHHAFSFFPDQSILAIPISDYSETTVTNALAVIKLDPAKGFTLISELPNTAAVYRSLRIGETLYSLAGDGVRAYSFDDFTKPLGTVDLPDDPVEIIPPLLPVRAL